MRSIAAILATLSLAAAGCAAGTGDTEPSAAWVGVITHEGQVTTVRNESGSLWGGTARLVEEASIGVDAGEDAYMLGRVRSIAASADRIYVVDGQVPALRAYQWNGVHLQDLGREGEGPGEFRNPAAVAVDAQGRVWLHDQGMQRIIVFTADGGVLTTRSLGGARISGGNQSMVLTPDGHAYVLDLIRPENPEAPGAEARVVMRPHDIEGPAGEPIDLPRFEDPAFLEARGAGMIRFQAIPFRANGMYALAPSRALLVGRGDDYRFEVRHADGHTTVVEKRWDDRVAVAPGESEAYRESAIAFLRQADPEWSWGDTEVPVTKPAFSRLIPTLSGETWVVRPGPASRDAACDEDDFTPTGEPHCWLEEPVVDVFGADGRYLGNVVVPAALQWDPHPYINGDVIIALVEDDAGTVMVKRYRLALPATPA